MEITRKLLLSVSGILIMSVECLSQNISNGAQDSLSLPKRAERNAASRLAIARPLNIEFIYSAPYNFTSEQIGKALPESRVTNFTQLKMSANYNFIKRKNWLMGATAGYRYTSVGADITHPGGSIKTTDGDFHYFFSAVNFSYFSTLFNKKTIYTSSLLVDGSEKHVERVKGMLTGNIVLKANQRTKLTVGLLVNIDPSSQAPVMPTFSYEHKFNNGLIADVIFPKSIYLRKYLMANGRLSLGAELDRTGFYLYNLDSTDQRYEYRQLDINSGLMYEHIIANHFVLTAKTGMKMTTSGRIFRKEDSFGSPVYQTTPDPTFYFNIGISFNPFLFMSSKK
ncbi:hypothetical protein [Chitinophaga sp. S165]|uniref:hypothetical protein n=1 Tax=Chitinophaga sp. S165 TaxID=2135462 RepID=UPI000D7105F8|nr:hypothetical protein [Chitinophaga sp. S165]PWV55888.1 hypothetical protein C7475_101398 [Chitinophaga sp. S165]